MLTLLRRKLLSCTIGSIILPTGQLIYTLEKPWIENKPYISCIPDGVRKITRNLTGRHQWFGVCDVVDRTFIEMHPANHVDELEGCIAPCMGLYGTQAVDSTDACNLLLDIFGDQDWYLDVRS
jgi:hypothetical protein